MKDHSEEKGFLSGKFENRESEPVPNGWFNIESVLDEDRRKRPGLIYFILPLAVLVSVFSLYLGYKAGHPSEPQLVQAEAAGIDASLQVAEKGLSAASSGEKTGEKKSKPGQGTQAGNDLMGAEKSQTTVPVSVQSESGTSELSPRVVTGNQTRKKVASAVLSSAGRSQIKVTAEKETGVGLQGNFVSMDSPEKDAERIEASPLAFVENSDSGPGISFRSQEQPIQELQGKIARLTLSEIKHAEPRYRILPPIPLRKKKLPLQYFAGVSFGYAGRTLTLNQSEAVHRMQIKSFGESWFAQVEASLQAALHERLKLLAGFQAGVYHQTLDVENISKQPDRYLVTKTDSLKFGLVPEESRWLETRTQRMAYANIEIGIKPLLIKELQSGPFVSLLFWTVLMQRYSGNGPDGFSYNQPQAGYAFGYRYGYQHLLAGNWNLQVFVTEMPAQILAQTQGLQTMPRFFGMGFQYLVK